MAVAFDAVGPSASGAGNTGTSPLTWSHTCGASATALYVGVAVGISVPGNDSLITVTATYNSLAMTALGKQSSGFTGITGNSGAIFAFVLYSPPTGSADTVSVSVTPGGTNVVNSISGGSISVTGSSTTGTLAGTFAQNVTSGSVPVTSTSTGNLCLAFTCDGSGGETWTAGTQQYKDDNSTASGAGCTTGATLASAGGTTTLSWTQTSDFYGAIGFEAQASGGGGGPAPALMPPAWTRPWRPALSRKFGPAMPFALPPAPAGPFTISTTASLSGAGTLTAAAAKPYIASIQGSGYTGYFADQNGSPRFWLMEMAWGLPGNAGRWNSGNWQSDMDAYFSHRAAQGYTAWWGTPWINHTMDSSPVFTDGRTWDGIYPLLLNGTPGTISTGSETVTLNSAFWTRTDYLINSALANGIAVFLNLGQKYDFDSSPASIWAHLSSAQAHAFGAAVAARYPQATYPNLHWVFGDDTASGAGGAITCETAFTQMLSGIRSAGDTRSVISLEQLPETNSHIEFDTGGIYVSSGFGVTSAAFNLCYTYGATPYVALEDSYNESGTIAIPPVWGDGIWYADVGTQGNDQTERRLVWWSLASGARGVDVTSGPSLTSQSPVLWTWQSGAVAALTSDPNGSFCTSAIGSIVSYFTGLTGWNKLVADYGSVLVTAGRGTRATSPAPGFNTRDYGDTDNYVCASRVADGSLAVIYGNAHFSITIDQTKMSAGYTATWVDPASLATSPATTGSAYTSTPKGNNSAGNPDWVLVLQGPPVTQASASLSGAGTLSVSGVTIGTTASLSGTGTLSATETFPSTAAMSGTGTLAASPALAATASLSGTGTLTASAGSNVPGSASLSGIGTLSVSGVITGTTVTMSGSGTLTAVPSGIAGAALSGAGSLTASWTLRVPVVMSGAGTLSAVPGTPGAAALTGTGTLTALPELTGLAALSGLGTLTAALKFPAAASLSGTGTLLSAPAGGFTVGVLTAATYAPAGESVTSSGR